MIEEPDTACDPAEEQEGKSLNELAGEGQIATPGAVQDWLEKYQGKSVKELLENTPTSVTAEYDQATKILTIRPSLPTEEEIWQAMKPVVFKEGCFGMRADLELLKSKCLNWMKHPEFQNEQTHENQHSEMKANLMLSYRHLEDARMRLGKAIQAKEGGKSILPR